MELSKDTQEIYKNILKESTDDTDLSKKASELVNVIIDRYGIESVDMMEEVATSVQDALFTNNGIKNLISDLNDLELVVTEEDMKDMIGQAHYNCENC